MAPWWLRAGNDDDSPLEEASKVHRVESTVDTDDLAAKTQWGARPDAEPEQRETGPEPHEPTVETDSETGATPSAESSDGGAEPPQPPKADELPQAPTADESPQPTKADESPQPAKAAEPPPAPKAVEGTVSLKRRRRRRRRRKPATKQPIETTETSQRNDEVAAPPSTTSLPSIPVAAEIESPLGVEVMPRGPLFALAERGQSLNDERKIAMFCDFENIALGVRDSEIAKLEISLILERLLEKGKIIVKKAYADWERYSEYKKPFHEAAIELIDIPQKYYSGKNSADIKMVVDAMDLCFSKEHLDTFVLVSGDSDFSPLVSKLKENNKYVIGVGVKNSSSNLLIDNCDEFIYYEDIWRDIQRDARLDNLSPKDAEVFGLLLDSMFALIRDNKSVLWGSMIKQTMQRKRPSFNEGYYGYSTFSELLEDAKNKNVISLKRDQRSGNYVVTGFAKSRSS